MNSDKAECFQINGISVSYNLFAYCENDPINDTDMLGYSSIKSVLSELIPRLISAANKFGVYLLNTFGLSKKKYAHKKKYNNASKLMCYVNDNKSKLKKATGIFGKIGTALECIVIVVECYSKINSNFSRSSFFQIADLLFYALKIALQKGISKFVSWVISTIGWMIWWAKFLIEVALEYLIDLIFKKFLSKAETYFANYLDQNKLTIGNCFAALFKSFKKCF